MIDFEERERGERRERIEYKMPFYRGMMDIFLSLSLPFSLSLSLCAKVKGRIPFLAQIYPN
jgi:hypothetical protein